ncbi:MAG: DNA polymerase III subunit gamma/tau [Gemmataceae bacterium]
MAKTRKSAATAPETDPETTLVADVAAPPGDYTVVARRYRPQQFQDLIGQEHVAQAMQNAIQTGRIAHAYLFTGARGVGKTSAARILAKALNCVKGPTVHPCDQCDICKSVATGDDVDVLEIDGASNNKVEEIRDLRNNVGFRPTRARTKIYIIDEVHMLTTSAFNALLKTLEEPPAHVKFIFATTEVQKIPITILSRCQRFDFAQVGPRQIFESLKHIVGREGLKAEDDALHLVAKRAAGSMRDSQSILDQLLAFSEGELTAAKVHALLGTAGDERLLSLAAAILANDARTALGVVQEATLAGLQLAELLDQLIDHWRGLMLAIVGGADYAELPGVPSYQAALRDQATQTNLDTVLAGLDVLTTARLKTRQTPHVGIILEMTVVRLSQLEQLVAVTQLLAGGAMPSSGKVGSAEAPKKKQGLEGPTQVSAGGTEKKATTEPTTITAANIAQVWPQIVDAIGGMAAMNLGKARVPAISGPNSLLIPFSVQYNPAFEYVRGERCLQQVRSALQKRTGQEWTVRVERDSLPSGQMSAEPEPPPRRDQQAEWLKLPMFATAATHLGAQLLRMDDDFNPTGPAYTTPAVPDTDELTPTGSADED